MLRLGNDVSLFEEFIGFYREDYPRLLETLRAAVKDKNAEAIHHAAHSLKGLVASLGATQVVHAASALERMGRARDLSEVDAAFRKLEAEIGHLNDDLASFRPSISTG
jgi:two-component system sensor histidine kinase/response regulator